MIKSVCILSISACNVLAWKSRAISRPVTNQFIFQLHKSVSDLDFDVVFFSFKSNLARQNKRASSGDGWLGPLNDSVTLTIISMKLLVTLDDIALFPFNAIKLRCCVFRFVEIRNSPRDFFSLKFTVAVARSSRLHLFLPSRSASMCCSIYWVVGTRRYYLKYIHNTNIFEKKKSDK